jgi:hypothetical protein
MCVLKLNRLMTRNRDGIPAKRNDGDTERWSLSWEEHGAVVEPEELKATVREKAETIGEKC